MDQAVEVAKLVHKGDITSLATSLKMAILYVISTRKKFLERIDRCPSLSATGPTKMLPAIPQFP